METITIFERLKWAQYYLAKARMENRNDYALIAESQINKILEKPYFIGVDFAKC